MTKILKELPNQLVIKKLPKPEQTYITLRLSFGLGYTSIRPHALAITQEE